MQKTVGAIHREGSAYRNQYRALAPGLQRQLPVLPVSGLLPSLRKLSLSVGRFWTVFALIVMFADVGGNGLDSGVEEGGSKGETSDVLKDVGVLDGLRR